MADIHGAQFRALARLSDKDDHTLAEPGQTCEQVPQPSLSWLWAHGVIEWVGNDLQEGEAWAAR